MQCDQNPEILQSQLSELIIEHRDLDLSIAQLTEAPSKDELQLRRLKKHKLQLKDRIALLERLLTPDELA